MTQHDHDSSHRKGGPHASTDFYLVIGAILTIITLMEVGVFYVPAFHSILIPVLLTLSAIKFAMVAMFYMHLKFDHRLFTGVFLLPLFIAIGVVLAIMLLFGVFKLG